MKKPLIVIALVLSLFFTFPIASPAQKKGQRPSATSAKGKPFRQYMRGERGGCYYVKNGKKVYVDRKYCN